MNINPRYIFTGLLVFLAFPLVSLATEKDPKQDEKVSSQTKEDSVGIYELENKVQDPFVLEDQPMINQAHEPTNRVNTSLETQLVEAEKTEQVEEDPNSAMSFNFIYFIIDKFKLADPMD